jgi:polyisoprenoid-binding protein YceI
MSVSQTQSATSQRESIPTSKAERYALDPSHSHVAFSVRHMMISNVRGEFQRFAGEVTYDPSHPTAARISATVDLASINTRDDKRDAHLRSPDFFNAEAFPEMTFVSTTIRPKGEGLEVGGELTIAQTTRPVTLMVDDITPEQKDPWGNARVGATAWTKIRRSDFGMTWNAALEAGGVLVGDEVTIQIDVELVKQK